MVDSYLSTYKPSLRDNISSLIAELLSSDKYAKQTINRRVGEVVYFIPGVGDAVGLDDASSDFKHGNYAKGSIGLASTLLGMVPGVGDAAASSVKAGTRRMFHGTTSPTKFSSPEGSLKDVGLHVTPDPNVASRYAGMDPYKEPTEALMLLNPSSVMSAVGKAPYRGVRYNDDYDWLADWFKEN